MSCDEDPLALRLFGLILMATSLARTAIWAYATLKPPLVHEPLDRASIWSGLALSAFPALVYVVAFAIAGVSPRASLAVYPTANSARSVNRESRRPRAARLDKTGASRQPWPVLTSARRLRREARTTPTQHRTDNLHAGRSSPRCVISPRMMQRAHCRPIQYVPAHGGHVYRCHGERV